MCACEATERRSVVMISVGSEYHLMRNRVLVIVLEKLDSGWGWPEMKRECQWTETGTRTDPAWSPQDSSSSPGYLRACMPSLQQMKQNWLVTEHSCILWYIRTWIIVDCDNSSLEVNNHLELQEDMGRSSCLFSNRICSIRISVWKHNHQSRAIVW
jgi:hypothetical protein